MLRYYKKIITHALKGYSIEEEEEEEYVLLFHVSMCVCARARVCSVSSNDAQCKASLWTLSYHKMSSNYSKGFCGDDLILTDQ